MGCEGVICIDVAGRDHEFDQVAVLYAAKVAPGLRDQVRVSVLMLLIRS